MLIVIIELCHKVFCHLMPISVFCLFLFLFFFVWYARHIISCMGGWRRIQTYLLKNVSKLWLIKVSIAVSVMFNVCLLRYKKSIKTEIKIAQEMRHKMTFCFFKILGCLYLIVDKKSTITGIDSIPSMIVDLATILETHGNLICQTSRPFVQLRKETLGTSTDLGCYVLYEISVLSIFILSSLLYLTRYFIILPFTLHLKLPETLQSWFVLKYATYTKYKNKCTHPEIT